MRPGLTTTMVAAAVFTACSRSESGNTTTDNPAGGTQADSARILASPGGFTEPEAARYDPDQDIYFVSNWGTGPTEARDNNGFISA